MIYLVILRFVIAMLVLLVLPEGPCLLFNSFITTIMVVEGKCVGEV